MDKQFEWTFSKVMRTSGCPEDVFRTKPDEETVYEIVIDPTRKRAWLFIEKSAPDGDTFRRRIEVDRGPHPSPQEAHLIDDLKAAAQADYAGGMNYEDFGY